MDLFSVNTVNGALAGDRYSFLYGGAFHDEHSARLLELSEEVLRNRPGASIPQHRLAFVMVEVYQNIVRHRAPADRGGLFNGSLFMLRSRTTGHHVASVNPVPEEKAGPLSEALRGIQGLDAGRLKAMFLERLQHAQPSEKGGAGLGLIEMMRRSGNPLSHALLPHATHGRLFVLQALVGGPPDDRIANTQVAELAGCMSAGGVLLLFRGEPTPGMQEVLLKVLEKDIGDRGNDGRARARGFLSAVEFLQGLPGSDTLIAFGTTEGGMGVVAGKVLPTPAAEETLAEVQALASMAPRDIERRYRDLLLGRVHGARAGSTGLYDLARRSRSPLRGALFQRTDGVLLLVEAAA